jgi:hypothetical protein
MCRCGKKQEGRIFPALSIISHAGNVKNTVVVDEICAFLIVHFAAKATQTLPATGKNWL